MIRYSDSRFDVVLVDAEFCGKHCAVSDLALHSEKYMEGRHTCVM